MQLVVTGIAITGFKGYKDTVKYQFGNKTLIKGDNHLGKSSIGEAIVWALTGCDMWGNEKATTKLINDQKPKVTEVVLDFLLDEEPNTIIRRKKGSSNEVYWNESKSSTSDIAREIFKGKNIFLSIFNPYYFPELSPKDAKALLSSVLKPVGRDEIFKELGDYLKQVLLDNEFRIPETFLADKRAELKEHEENIIYLEGVVDGSKPMEVGEKKEFDETELNSLEEELKKYNNSDNYSVRLSQLTIEENIVRARLNNISYEALIPVEAKEREKEYLLKQYKDAKHKLTNIEEKFIKCNECGNKIDLTEDSKQMLKNVIDEILPKGKALADEIEEIKNKNLEIEKRNQAIKAQMEEEVKIDLEKILKERQAIQVEIEKINTERADKTSSIESRIKALIEERESVRNFNSEVDAAIKHNEKLSKDIERSKERIQNSKNKIEHIKLAIDAGKQYNSIKVKKQATQINKYLDHVSIQFEKVTKDGELKDDFKVLLDGKEFSKLSGSEKITAGLEIANLLMNVQNMFIPIFVDDGERINVIPELETQMIVTKVTLDKEISVEIQD